MGIGALDQRVTFRRLETVDDGRGNVTIDWVDRFTAAASVRYLRGSEAVLQARLNARQPCIMTIRTHQAARQLEPEDIAVNARTGEAFNIRERPRSADDGGYLEFLAEAGVVT